MSITAVAQATTRSNREVLDPITWERVSRRIALDEDVRLDEAEQMLDALIGFLALCSEFPDETFSPSPQVDAAWHVFLIYTEEYYQFCVDQFGQFMHHAPSDMPPRVPLRTASARSPRTAVTWNVLGPALWSPIRAAHTEPQATGLRRRRTAPGPMI